MEDATAQKFNATYNAYKHVMRELYIGNHLLLTAEPFYLDIPYTQKMGSPKVFATMEGAMDEVREIYPNAIIKVPDTVRR